MNVGQVPTFDAAALTTQVLAPTTQASDVATDLAELAVQQRVDPTGESAASATSTAGTAAAPSAEDIAAVQHAIGLALPPGTRVAASG